MSTTPNRKWWIIITIMLAAMLEVLDTTIVNVALPNMMASLSATQNQITWVLSSYVVASAIMLPLTGFLSNRLGRRNMMLYCIVGFLASSMLCGLSSSLIEMVCFRLAQGAFGAALIPLSQAIMRENFSAKELPKAMAIWGIGLMAAPVFGPTLGGYIIAHLSWRWIFYINIPVCFFAILMTVAVITNTEKRPQKLDLTSLLLMVVSIGALQLLLDQGNQQGWFSSYFILSLAALSATGTILFIIRSLSYPNCIITLSIFKDRNFTLCTIIMLVFCGALFGIMALEPIMLERLFHYPTLTTGLVMMPMGIGSALGMGLSSALMKHINVKYVFIIGLLVSAFGCHMLSEPTLQVGMHYFLLPNGIIGVGLGFFMVPLSTYSLLTLAKKDYTEGAGLFSYGRMLGTAIGISLMSTLLSRETQSTWHTLIQHITRFNVHVAQWLHEAHLPSHIASKTGLIVAHVVEQQSMMQGFIDGFHLASLIFIGLILAVLLLKQVDLAQTD